MIKKVIVILGQTATGKSALAVKLARKFNGEIISADSRQVYKELNIGSGKIKKKEMLGVPHHLLDVASIKRLFTKTSVTKVPGTHLGAGHPSEHLNEKFSVIEYQKLAEQKIKEILERGNTPIICGGTGLYIDSLTKGTIFPEVLPDLKLRKNLAQKSATDLFKKLQKLDPARAENIDAKNKVRLIRAIEIVKALGKVPPLKSRLNLDLQFIKIGLYLPAEKLKFKIKERVLAKSKSMILEAKKLHRQGLSWKRMEELGLEYRYLSFYIQKKITREEMFEKLNSETYKYAKRQMTWFKRDPEIKWFDASKLSIS
jgi:tRNA dimethylallyltransferase